MKKISISVIVIFLLTFALAVPAFATPPTEGGGDFTLIAADEFSATFVLTGMFEGEFVQYFTPGRADRGLFTGSIGGSDPGSLMFNVLVATDHNPGHFTSIANSGSDGLGGAHTQGRFVVDETGLSGTYTGRYHFDP